MTETSDIAIVGAGPVAVSLALGLSSAGVNVQLVGPMSSTEFGAKSGASLGAFDSRVYALTPGSIDWLKQSGLWQGLDTARSSPVRSMMVSDPQGAPLRFDTAAQPAQIVEHSALAFAANTALKFSKVRVLDSQVTGVERLPNEIRLTVSRGQTVHAPLVIAADGANSLVRQALGVEATAKPYAHCALVTNLLISTERLEANAAFQWFGRDDIIALLPLPAIPNVQAGRHFNLVWSCAPELAQSLAKEPSNIAQALGESLSRIDPVVGAMLAQAKVLGEAKAIPLQLLKAKSLIAERLCLVGDAAHVIHPLAGQGMNLGFGDAQALFKVITERERLRDLGDPILLRRYARQRSLAIARMQWTTDGLSTLFAEPASGHNAIKRAFADVIHWGWQRLDSIEPLKRQLIKQASR